MGSRTVSPQQEERFLPEANQTVLCSKIDTVAKWGPSEPRAPLGLTLETLPAGQQCAVVASKAPHLCLLDSQMPADEANNTMAGPSLSPAGSIQ